MMNRRWFFTAAGGAFLAAACTTVRGGRGTPPAVPEPLPLDPDRQWAALLASFHEGLERERDKMLEKKVNLPPDKFPRERADLEKIFDGRLRDIYWDRFEWRRRSDEFDMEVFKEALHQACILGQFTALAFAYHTGVADDPEAYSLEARDREAKLQGKHLDWARDLYGYLTNSGAKKKRVRPLFPGPLELCHVDLAAEINEPCPFCHG